MAFVSKTLLVLLGLALLSCALGNDERIVGGTIAKKKFRKFLSQLYIGGSFGCTGSILSDQYILTAAHCFDGISGRPNLVRRSFLYVGQRSADPDSSVPYYDFETVYMHKDYDESDKALRNDVAIVKIKQTLPSGSVHKVKLVSGPRPNKVVTVAGYGALNEDGTSASYAMQTKVVTKGFQECRNADRASFRNVLFKKYHVCAVSLGYPNEGRTDSCCTLFCYDPG